MPVHRLTVAQRWNRFVLRGNGDECWLWTGAIDSKGYGSMGVDGRTDRAHRVSVRLATGKPIPVGMYVDHMCMNRQCVNPAHLRVVTPRISVIENSRSFAALRAAATHCDRGHEKTPENTYYRPSGGRMCRVCQKERTRLAWQRKKLSLGRAANV
jgi:hypothetical protein